jgi:CHAT domain/SIR2-like domain
VRWSGECQAPLSLLTYFPVRHWRSRWLLRDSSWTKLTTVPRTLHKYADLEIAFRKRDERSYSLGFRFNGADDEAEQRSEPDPVVAINFDSLTLSGDDPIQYAATLSAALFTAEVAGLFGRFRTAAEQQDAILRVRLSIESSAPELHAVHWETLRDPLVADAPLFTGEQTVVSRFLSSGQDWRPIRLRPRTDLRALVAVANPARASTYNLAPIDVINEELLASQAMTGIEVETLAPGGALPLTDLGARLREGFDILYLICHGLLKDTEPFLCLDEGAPVPAQELVQMVRELAERPRLIVLASCQSAGQGGVGLAALGPRLAEAGVPAVIAMQGDIFMQTAAAFMKRFFGELLVDGQIDRAMSVARGEVRDRDDFWMPVLFMRLRNGRIWYEPGFDASKGEFEQWDSICRFVRRGDCVPILGPDVAEHILGSSRSLAAELAQDTNFPLDSHDRFDLAKVAQYMMTQNSLEYVQGKVIDEMFAQLEKTGERLLNRPVADDPNLLDAIVDELMKEDDPRKTDPLKLVAGLNAKVFVNASSDSLLERFIARTPVFGASKQPVPLASEWRDETLDYKNEAEPLDDASIERPYVYYLFGNAQRESTWVLTQDDFFDYLIRTTRYQLMPPVVSDALVSGSLLFLGFPLDDWKFRVMFRLILAKGGRKLLESYNHVGVQVDPGETAIANARRARKYLERYFFNSRIDIYWGSAADFLRELKIHLDKETPPSARRRI